MNLLTVVNALNYARDDADAGLLELVLELRGDMLVYGYKRSEAINTRMIMVKDFPQMSMHTAIYFSCKDIINEMIAHNLNFQG